MVRDSGSRQKARFGLAENELSLGIGCGNAAGVSGMEMREMTYGGCFAKVSSKPVIDQEVPDAGMAHPVNQHGEIARRMNAARFVWG